ncbi:MAG: SH3 domain-containing protein [Leptospiraceae bacterium]|nr:SH3 domain-containing protein [Leptospiraceae bacterium]
MRNAIIIVAVVLGLQCGDTPDHQSHETKFVSADGGLRMRQAPSLESARTLTIPDGSPVLIYETTGESLTISGRSGKWTRVDFEGNEGWVFGGFLVDEAPSPSPVAPATIAPGKYCFESGYSSGWVTLLTLQPGGTCSASFNFGEGFYEYDCTYKQQSSKLLVEGSTPGVYAALSIESDGSLLPIVAESAQNSINDRFGLDTGLVGRPCQN